jgi:hypothetical protein
MAAKRSVSRPWQAGRSANAAPTALRRAPAALRREILPPADAAVTAARLPPPQSRSQPVAGTARHRPEAATCGD